MYLINSCEIVHQDERESVLVGHKHFVLMVEHTPKVQLVGSCRTLHTENNDGITI